MLNYYNCFTEHNRVTNNCGFLGAEQSSMSNLHEGMFKDFNGLFSL